MPGYYKYFIEENNGFRFVLYPNNNNSQMIGQSNAFNSYDEAKENLSVFKKIMDENQSNIKNSVLITFNNNRYYFKFVFKNQNIIFERINGYTRKESCLEEIESICKNFNAPLRIKK